MKILVVDDEKAIRNSLKEILGDEGYEVDAAEDGLIAEEMIEKEYYDVIFCDIKMPGKDGVEVLICSKQGHRLRNGDDFGTRGHDTAVECIKRVHSISYKNLGFKPPPHYGEECRSAPIW